MRPSPRSSFRLAIGWSAALALVSGCALDWPSTSDEVEVRPDGPPGAATGGATADAGRDLAAREIGARDRTSWGVLPAHQPDGDGPTRVDAEPVADGPTRVDAEPDGDGPTRVDAARDAAPPDAALDAAAFDAAPEAAAPDAAPPEVSSQPDLTPPPVLLGLGTPCQDDNVCFSGTCADGRCCNQPCGAPCRSCALPGHQGVCSAVPGGSAPLGGKTCGAAGPAAGCGADGSCDGRGNCRLWPKGTPCALAACVGGANKVTLGLASACDGIGGCLGLGTIECAPYTCDGKSASCRASCTKAKQCSGGTSCDADGRCDGVATPLGAVCGSPDACASGHCVEGVCCDGACGGTCESCKLVGAAGRCLPLPAGAKPLPPNVCPDQSATQPCGQDGRCDGDGACRVRPAGTTCAPPTCVDGASASALELWTCNGLLQGPACAAQALPCGPYRCQLGVPSCFGRCNGSDQCQAGSVCVDRLCVAEDPANE